MNKGLLFHWTDKNGNKLTAKEFMQRWKEGIANVTPLQQAKMTLLNYIPIFIGIIFGIVASAWSKTWWLLIILIGSFGITLIQTLGVFQRYMALKEMEVQLNLIRANEKEVSNEKTK